MADAEAPPAPKPEPEEAKADAEAGELGDAGRDAPKPEAEAGVGVLGWLGFVIINFAAWGIITTASWIAWFIGFGICLVYTGIIVGLAVWLERRGQKYRQFVNLLWVLGCWFVFILGVYISVQIIGRIGEDGDDGCGTTGGGSNADLSASDLSSLLPSGASQELQNWASTTDWTVAQNPTFASFNGSVFFGGSEGNSGTTNYLWYSSGAAAAQVTPEVSDASSFTEFQSELYFAAQSTSTGQELWRIEPGALGTAVLVKEVVAGSSGSQVRHLVVDAATSTLYFKASFNCPDAQSYVWVNTIFSSNGTTAGTVDLRGDPCAAGVGGSSSSGCSSSSSKPTRASLWGVMLVAAAPMLALAAFVLVRKRMPGVFINLFGGVLCIVVVAYLLASYDDDELSGLPSFLKWFITVYTVVLWLAILVWSLVSESLLEWLEELKTWAVAVVGVSFFIILHVDLEIPFNGDAWRWIIYALLAAAQVLLSAAVSRTVPMVAGAIGSFVVAWKVAYEIVEFADFSGSELKLLCMLAIVGLQGIGIIVLAIFYASRREEIDNLVRRMLTCKWTQAAAVKNLND